MRKRVLAHHGALRRRLKPRVQVAVAPPHRTSSGWLLRVRVRNAGRPGTFAAQLTVTGGTEGIGGPVDLGWRREKGGPQARLGYRDADLLRVAVACPTHPVPYVVPLAARRDATHGTRYPNPIEGPLLLTIRLSHCESDQLVAEECLAVSFREEDFTWVPSVSLTHSRPAIAPTADASRLADPHKPLRPSTVRRGSARDLPDLVLIMTDQQRFDQVGYESDGFFETPHIDELAAQGVVFDRAYSGGTICVPARVSLLTGLQHHRVPKQRGSWLSMREGFWTIARELQSAGYETALVGKMHATPIRAQHGFDSLRLCEHLGNLARPSGMDPEDTDDYGDWLLARGMDDWRDATPDDWLRDVGRWFPYDAMFHPTAWVEREARSVLGARDPDRPLFLIVSFPHPHAPLNPPEPYSSRYDASQMSLPADGFEVNAQLPAPFLDAMTSTRKGRTAQRVEGAEKQVLGRLSRTRALIAQIDDAVGRILERIDLAKTLVVFTSDHGDYAGHRGLLQKEPWIPFDDLARVPLVVSGLDATSGGRVSSLVQSFDFVPTCLDFAGIDFPSHVLDGRSLRSLLLGSNEPEDTHRSVTCTTPGWPMIRLGPYKYIRHRESGRAVLFDLDRDPGETTDVLGLAAYASIGSHLERLLDEALTRGIPELAPSGFIKNSA
ncbi:MAG: arylsulfatase [Actinomycetota bacterium]|nr:arylsulfatase [Actinomycetota bacterium]